MKITRFGKFKTNESVDKSVELYRLTNPIVDLESPGEYYFTDKNKIQDDLLKNSSDNLFLITVKCNSSNIDNQKSEEESNRLGNENIAVVKDPSDCEIVSVVPYK